MNIILRWLIYCHKNDWCQRALDSRIVHRIALTRSFKNRLRRDEFWWAEVTAAMKRGIRKWVNYFEILGLGHTTIDDSEAYMGWSFNVMLLCNITYVVMGTNKFLSYLKWNKFLWYLWKSYFRWKFIMQVNETFMGSKTMNFMSWNFSYLFLYIIHSIWDTVYWFHLIFASCQSKTSKIAYFGDT